MSPSSYLQDTRSANCSPIVLLPEPDTPISTSAHGIRFSLSVTKVLRQSSFVDQPDGVAATGMRPVRGEILACEHARQDRPLFRTRHLEQHFPAGAQRGQGQRDPWHEWFDMRLWYANHP